MWKLSPEEIRIGIAKDGSRHLKTSFAGFPVLLGKSGTPDRLDENLG